MRQVMRFFLVLLALTLMSAEVYGQVTTGTILGTVTDASGGVVPGSTVTIRNIETGISRSLTTNAAGRYVAPQLPLGRYEVTAEATGFQTFTRSGIEISVGRQAAARKAVSTRRPRRRSRVRDEGRGNRAAGRAASVAAWLSKAVATCCG